MTRQIESQGPSLEAALVHAIADLVDCDAEKVELDLSAPGLAELRGRVRLDLEIEPAPAEHAAEASETDAEVEAEPEAVDVEEVVISAEELDEEAESAADFLEGLLDAMDLPGDLRIRVKDEHAEVEITDVGSGALIGRRGQTLEAVQELVRCALQRRFERRSRVQVDVEGYRARRLEKLIEKAEEAIDEVLDSGEPERLEPMDVFERKVIHQLVAEVDGLSSRSQGREPGRRVVIEPN
jgi:spoIIIJ-associated protein